MAKAKSKVDAEGIAELLRQPLTAIAVSFGTSKDGHVMRESVRVMLREHASELAKRGVGKKTWDACEELLSDAIAEAVSDAADQVKMAFWVLSERKWTPDKKIEPLTPNEIEAYFKLDRQSRQELSAPESGWEVFLPDYLAPRLREAFRRLDDFPFSYVLTVRTPIPTSWYRVISPILNLGSSTLESLPWAELRPEDVAMHGPNERLQQQKHQLEIREENYHLTLEHDGYLPWSPATFEGPVVALRNEMKAFLGLCIAMELIAIDANLDWDHVEPVIAFENSSATGKKLALRWLPPEESAVVGALRPIPVETDANRAYLKRRMSWITAAFRRPNDQLVKAGRWLFESYCGTNHLLQLVQAITVLEILFGEDEKQGGTRSHLGTTDLLANRYAYVVGNTSATRSAAEKTFRHIYKVRSRIVHSGTDEVDPEVLIEARSMSIKAIARELAIHAEV